METMNQSDQQLLSLADWLDRRDNSENSSDPSTQDDSMARHALLISSFTEGLLKSKEAQRFLRNGLLSSMLRQEAHQRKSDPSGIESSISNTTSSSSLNVTTVEAIKKLKKGTIELILNQMEDSIVKFVYIPTAMFARKEDSPNSDAKQLREARQVAQERRSEITNHVSDLLGDSVSVHSVTLDLNDGSISEKDGAETAEHYPEDGREALGDWKPNLVYVEGGNTFWLYHCIEKGDWRESIIDAVTGEEAAVYCGKSAGAIIAGATVETATWKEWDDPSIVPGKECYDDWKAMEGLNLISGDSIFPHMGKEWSSMIAENKKEVPSPVHTLTDAEVGLFNGINDQLSVVEAQYRSLSQ